MIILILILSLFLFFLNKILNSLADSFCQGSVKGAEEGSIDHDSYSNIWKTEFMLVDLLIYTYLRDLLALELSKGLYIENLKGLIELQFYSFMVVSSCGKLTNEPYEEPGSFCDFYKLWKGKVYGVIDCKGYYGTEHDLELSLCYLDEHWQHHFDSKVHKIIAGFDLKLVILAEVYCEALKCQHGFEVARDLGVKSHEGLGSW